MLIVDDRIHVPLKELQFTFVRSQGPGGQNVNKVSTKVVLRWRLVNNRSLPEDVLERFRERYKRRITKEGDLVLTSQRFRDRGRNIADCVTKLRAMLAEVAQPVKKRRPTRPTKASKGRRRRQKEVTSKKKQLRRAPTQDD